MLRAAAKHWDQPYVAHFMGVAIHVYADTFDPQGFAGVIRDYDQVDNLDSPDSSLLERIRDALSKKAPAFRISNAGGTFH